MRSPSPPPKPSPAPFEPALQAPALGRVHAQRLREVYRSAGWPSQDAIELDLLAAGLLRRVRQAGGHESLRVTEAGIAFIARAREQNRAALGPHEMLVERIAREMARAGRIAWRGLRLRAQVPREAGPAAAAHAPLPLQGLLQDEDEAAAPAPGPAGSGGALRWVLAQPDVFSIRNTTVAAYVEPVVHEVKVRRADLLGDLKRPAKRAAYLWLGECWYVLGQDARGRPIAEPDEIPSECGVLLAQGDRLVLARPAARRAREPLPFEVWMALAKATPAVPVDDEAQGRLGADEA